MNIEQFKSWDNAILIIPREDQLYFLKCKEKYPTLSFHMFTKEDILDQYYGKAKNNAFYVWYQKHTELSYAIAELYFKKATKLYLSSLDEKVLEVEQVRKELFALGLIEKKPYFSYYLHQHSIYIYGYENDAELSFLFELENIKTQAISIEKKEKEKKVLEFETIEDEVVFTIQKILELYQKGISLSRISVLMKGSEYTYPFYKLAQEFHLPIEPLFEEKCLYLEETQNVIRYYEKNHTLEDYETQNDTENKVKERIIKFLSTYDFSSFSFLTVLELIKKDLRSLSLEKEHYEDEIKFSKRHLYLDDEYVFILGFEQGQYPVVHRDDDFFPNATKKMIHQNTSVQENLNEEKRIEDLIFANENVFISYKKKALDGLHHLSMLAGKWNLPILKPSFSLVSYSLSYTKRKYAELRDFERKYGVWLKERGHYSFLEPFSYRSYRNQFQGSNLFKLDSPMEHSYSSLKLYAQCPYHYYLEKCLKLDPFEGNFYTKFGTLAHAILERNYEKNADYDQIFDELKSEFAWDEKENLLLVRLKNELKVIWNFNLNHYQKMEHPQVILESTFVLPLHEYAHILGKVDKLIVLKEDQSLCAIVDYKTGNEKFNPDLLPYGLSLQLPIYSMLLKGKQKVAMHRFISSPYQKTLMIGGYIQQVLPSKAVTTSKEKPSKEKKYYTLNGWTLDEERYIRPFDPTFVKSEFITGLRLTSNGLNAISKEKWEEYEELTRQLLLEMDRKIRGNEFPIHPKYIDSTIESCTLCPFKDICYVEEKDKEIIILKKKKGEDESAELDG